MGTLETNKRARTTTSNSPAKMRGGGVWHVESGVFKEKEKEKGPVKLQRLDGYRKEFVVDYLWMGTGRPCWS
jgi:hypothetical protein